MQGLTNAAPRIGWLPLLHSSNVSLKAGPRPLTMAFILIDADDAMEVDVAPCNRSVMQSHCCKEDGRRLKERAAEMRGTERKSKGERWEGAERKGREEQARDRANAKKKS